MFLDAAAVGAFVAALRTQTPHAVMAAFDQVVAGLRATDLRAARRFSGLQSLIDLRGAARLCTADDILDVVRAQQEEADEDASSQSASAESDTGVKLDERISALVQVLFDEVGRGTLHLQTRSLQISLLAELAGGLFRRNAQHDEVVRWERGEAVSELLRALSCSPDNQSGGSYASSHFSPGRAVSPRRLPPPRPQPAAAAAAAAGAGAGGGDGGAAPASTATLSPTIPHSGGTRDAPSTPLRVEAAEVAPAPVISGLGDALLAAMDIDTELQTSLFELFCREESLYLTVMGHILDTDPKGIWAMTFARLRARIAKGQKFYQARACARAHASPSPTPSTRPTIGAAHHHPDCSAVAQRQVVPLFVDAFTAYGALHPTTKAIPYLMTNAARAQVTLLSPTPPPHTHATMQRATTKRKARRACAQVGGWAGEWADAQARATPYPTPLPPLCRRSI